jgi:hypothetical protein
MSRPMQSQGFQRTELASGSRGAARRAVAGLGRRALAAVDDAVAGLLFWHEVSRTIETLLTLDDASLRRRGFARNEVVPAVFRAARARWQRRHD